MSQDEFGSSPVTSVPSPQVVPSEHETLSLQQQLHDCTENCQQTHALLNEAQAKLHEAEQAIQLQEIVNLALHDRITQLEQDFQIKSEQLIQSLADCDDLRDRLKRQQHHTSQLKAALERCLDAPANIINNHSEVSELESWSISKFAEEQIANFSTENFLTETISQNSLQDVVKIAPAIPVTSQQVLADIVEIRPDLGTNSQESDSKTPVLENSIQSDETKPSPINFLIAATLDTKKYHQTPLNKPNNANHGDSLSNSVMPQVIAPRFIQALSDSSVAAESEPAYSSTRKSVTSLAGVKLPQFPPLRR